MVILILISFHYVGWLGNKTGVPQFQQPIGAPFIQQQQQQFLATQPQQQPLQIPQPIDQPAFQVQQQQQPQLAPSANSFTPSIAFQPQQQQPQPFNSNLVPTILPIGNIPLQP